MEIKKRQIGIVISLLIVFISGGMIGFFGSSYLYQKHVFARATERNVYDASWQIITVCKLRMGEVDDAVYDLEREIDSDILAIASTQSIAENEALYHVLGTIRTYRELYPSNSDHASIVMNALQEFPKRTKFECEDSFCRLVRQDQSLQFVK